MSGLCTSGYLACPLCGTDLDVARALDLKKEVYLGGPLYLPMSHPFRDDSLLGVENRPTPRCRTPMDWWNTWQDIQNGVVDQADTGMNRLAIWYELPYWKVCGSLKTTSQNLHIFIYMLINL